MTDVIESIASAGYTPAAGKVRELGALAAGAGRLTETIGTTYLRSLVGTSQAIIATDNVDRDTTAHLNVLRRVSREFYPEILAGVTTADIAHVDGLAAAESRRRSLERNQRSNFARSAESTLRRWVEAGGDITKLPTKEVTKSGLYEGLRGMRENPGVAPLAPTAPRSPASDYSLAMGACHEAFSRLCRKLTAAQTAASIAAGGEVHHLRAVAESYAKAIENLAGGLTP